MGNYISSEHLKHKNTFAKKLVWLAPILTLFLNVLAPMWYQQNSYNWWYVLLYPSYLTLLSILIIQRDNGKLKFRAILSLPIDLKKIWYLSVFFNYELSFVVDWLNNNSKLRKLCNIDHVPTVSSIQT